MKYFSLLVFPCLLFSSCSLLPQLIEPAKDDETKIQETVEIPENNSVIDAEKQTSAIEESFLKTEEKIHQETQTYKISHVIDGDTLYVIVNGKERKIRVMGIDTPEKNGGFRTAECFGDDASVFAKEFLQGKRVSLLESKKGDKSDKYGRWLRYVFVDGKDFGAMLIEEGYAESYKKFPHDRKSYYNSLEKNAQKNHKGMWNSENCSFWGQEN